MKKPESSFLKPGAVIDLVAITLLWCLAVIIVNPIGDFPLNDDWSYGLTVHHFLERPDYRPVSPMCMPLISQVVWGAIFCIPGGYSFTPLRFSTLVLAWIGVVGLYLLIRQLHRSRTLATICALLLAFNPVYFALSNTFMTDVPFTTMAVLSSLFFIRYFQTGSILSLVAATIPAVAGVFCRQLGIAIPMAFTITLILRHSFQKRNLALALMPSIVVIGCWAGFNHWLRATGRVPEDYDIKTDNLLAILSKPLTVPLFVVHRSWNTIMYLGLFLLPFLVVIISTRALRPVTIITKLVLALFVAITAARFIFMPALMPVHNNVLDPHGIGPFTLRDMQLAHLPHVTPLSPAFWTVVTAITLFGTWVLIFRSSVVVNGFFSVNKATGNPLWRRALSLWQSVFQDPTEATNRTIATYFLICSAIYLAPLMVAGFFDRYLLPVVVFLAAFLGATMKDSEESTRPWRRLVAIFLIAGFAWYSVAGTRDYLTWNRVRWTAAGDLQRANISPDRIDGGYEYDGYYCYVPNYHPKPGKSDWWVVDDEYLLSFGEMVGFEKIKEYQYDRWLPPSRGKLFVLKRKSSAQTQPPAP